MLQQAYTFHQQNDFEQARTLYQSLLVETPEHVEALALYATLLAQCKEMDEAHHYFQKVLALAPSHVNARFNQAFAYEQEGQWERALTAYQQLLHCEPGHFSALKKIAGILFILRRPAEALMAIEQAISVNALDAQAQHHRSLILHELQRHDEALMGYDLVLDLSPHYLEAVFNRSLLLQELQQFAGAMQGYQQVLHINPQYSRAFWNLCLCQLTIGQFDLGWHGYESRWEHLSQTPSFQQLARFNTSALSSGCSVILWPEQGIGDTLQFCRYARIVADLGASVVLQVPSNLASLCRTIDERITVVEDDSSLNSNIDFHCPLPSLPLACGTDSVNKIPAQTPYLFSDPIKRQAWRERLEERFGQASKLRIGMAWSGGHRPNQPELWSVNERRNIPLIKLARLKHPSIDFISLQKGEAAEQELVDVQAANWDGPLITSYSEHLIDFSDTAALIDNLDLVIAVDTSVAHLAGAMGKPVWILNRSDACWRWLYGQDLNRTDSPWYPTARLFRQPKAGDWDSVVEQVREALEGFR